MKKLLFFLMLLGSLNLIAQDKYQISQDDYSNTKVEMADDLRQSGKIYVVVAVIATIFVGLTFYMVRLDQKIGQLEKDLEQEGE